MASPSCCGDWDCVSDSNFHPFFFALRSEIMYNPILETTSAAALSFAAFNAALVRPKALRHSLKCCWMQCVV